MFAPPYKTPHTETVSKEPKLALDEETVKDQSANVSEQSPSDQTEHVSNQSPQVTDDSKDLTNEEKVEGGKDSEEGEEEEGECGFCLFMKGGGCKDAFIAWEDCIKEVEKNPKDSIAEKCFEVSSTLMQCMSAHSDYYAPILQAEKAAEERATKELEKETESSGRSLEKEVTIEVPQEDPLKDKQQS